MEADKPKLELVNIGRNVNVVLKDDNKLLEAAVEKEAI